MYFSFRLGTTELSNQEFRTVGLDVVVVMDPFTICTLRVRHEVRLTYSYRLLPRVVRHKIVHVDH